MTIDELMDKLDGQATELQTMSAASDLALFKVTFESIFDGVSEIWQLYPQDFLLSVSFYALQDAKNRYLNDALNGDSEAFASVQSIVKQQINTLLLH